MRTARAKGSDRAPHPGAPRAPDVAHRLRLAVRPRLRRPRRRRRAADGGGLRPARGRQAHLRLAAEPRPARDHGDGHVRGLLRRRWPTRWWTSCTRGSTRGCVMPEPGTPLLDVRDLRVSFRTEDGVVQRSRRPLVRRSRPGEVLGIVGESGSGKTRLDAGRDAADPGSQRGRRGPGALPRPRPDEAPRQGEMRVGSRPARSR